MKTKRRLELILPILTLKDEKTKSNFEKCGEDDRTL